MANTCSKGRTFPFLLYLSLRLLSHGRWYPYIFFIQIYVILLISRESINKACTRKWHNQNSAACMRMYVKVISTKACTKSYNHSMHEKIDLPVCLAHLSNKSASLVWFQPCLDPCLHGISNIFIFWSVHFRPSTDLLLRRFSSHGLIRCRSTGLMGREDILIVLSCVHAPHMWGNICINVDKYICDHIDRKEFIV